MDLKLVNTFTIEPTKPFDFDSTFHKPDHFPSGDTYFESGCLWHTYFWNDRQIGLKVENKGTKEKPEIMVTYYDTVEPTNTFCETLKEELIYRFNLNLDLLPFYRELGSEPVLKEALQKFNGMRPGHAGSLYEYLIIGIVLQNCTVKRSVQMLQTLFENYGQKLSFDEKELWAFWAPGGLGDVKEEDLRQLKLGYRAKSIKEIDEAFSQNLIDEVSLRKENIEAQKSELLKLYGVGPATVWYLLFDIFHQYNFFEHISPWEQKIYSKLFFDHDPDYPVPIEKIIKHFEKYGKYRQLAVHYIWEDLWWKRKNESIPWLEKLIRI